MSDLGVYEQQDVGTSDSEVWIMAPGGGQCVVADGGSEELGDDDISGL